MTLSKLFHKLISLIMLITMLTNFNYESANMLRN